LTKLQLKPAAEDAGYSAFKTLQGKVDEIGRETQRIGKLKATERAACERELLALRYKLVIDERINTVQRMAFCITKPMGSRLRTTSPICSRNTVSAWPRASKWLFAASTGATKYSTTPRRNRCGLLPARFRACRARHYSPPFHRRILPNREIFDMMLTGHPPVANRYSSITA
jgi:hypothetical protein